MAAVVGLASCMPASGHGPAGSPGESSGAGPAASPAQPGLRGRITVAGEPVTAAEVLIVVDGKVVSAAPASPSYQLPAVAACAKASLVVRLSEPVIGVWPSPLASGCGGAHDIDIPSRQVVELRGAIQLPAGTAFDWVELKLTPKLPGVPPAVVLAEGTSSDLREALAVRKLTRPAFDLRLIAGTWAVRADRFVDAPPGARPPTLVLDHVEVTGGAARPATRGGVDLPVTASSSVELVLRVDAG